MEGKGNNPYTFWKEIFSLWGVPYWFVVGLPAYPLGNPGSKDAMLLPEFNNKPFPQLICKLFCLKNPNLNLGLKRLSDRKLLSNWASALSKPVY